MKLFRIGLCFIALVCDSAFAALAVTGVSAQQRYPWNGMVDVSFTIMGEEGKKYATSFVARDVVGGTNLTMKTLYKSDGTAAALTNQLAHGTYKWVWDAAADLPDGFDCERVAVDVNTSEVAWPIDGLRVYWPFDGNGNDVSGNAFNMGNSGVAFALDRFGNSSKAAYFNGSGRMTLNKAIGVKNTMSFSMWVKPERSGYYSNTLEMPAYNTTTYVWKDFPMILIPNPGTKSSTTTSYYLTPGEIGISVGMESVEIFAITSLGSTELKCFYSKKNLSLGGAWHHVAVVVNNRAAPKVYLDGVALSGSSAAFSKKITIGSGNVQETVECVKNLFIATQLDFGGRATNSYYDYSTPGNQAYKGYIDDFMIYNRVLTDDEILQLSQWK